MLGILIGVIFGAAQFFLLLTGVRSVSAGKIRIIPLAAQFLCPFAGLLVCALIIIGILIAGAVANTLIYLSRSRGNRK